MGNPSHNILSDQHQIVCAQDCTHFWAILGTADYVQYGGVLWCDKHDKLHALVLIQRVSIYYWTRCEAPNQTTQLCRYWVQVSRLRASVTPFINCCLYVEVDRCEPPQHNNRLIIMISTVVKFRLSSWWGMPRPTHMHACG